MWQRIWFYLLQLLGCDPRGIFHYWDGRQWRSGDPIVLARGLMSHATFDWDDHPFKIDDPDLLVSSNAVKICADAVRELFGVPKFSDGGLTESELCGLLWSFQNYLAAVKKNGSGPQTPLPPTEPQPSFPGEGYITRPVSDSGLTPSDPVIATPGT